MRVLVVVHRFLPKHLAGVEVQAAALSRGLAERGHAVRIFSGDPAATAPGMYQWEGLPVDVVPWGVGGRPGPVSTFLAGFRNPAVERRFAEVCAAFQPEIVHIQHLMGLSPRLPVLGRRNGARVIIALHDFWFVCSNTWLYRWHRAVCPGPGWGYHCGGCALHRLGGKPQPVWMALAAPLFAARTAVLRRALFDADRLIAPSRLVARIFASHRIPAERIAVVPHGLSSALKPARVPEPPRPVRFLYIGSLIPPKGAHVAIQAFNRLDDPSAQFHLYGDPTSDPGYADELRASARHPGIEFKGLIAHGQVGDILREADVLLVPSLWYETFSIVVDEAWEAGLPVLASDHGAAAERIAPGENGLTAPPGDVDEWQRQISRLARDPELRARLRQGIQPPKRLADCVSEYEAVYAGVLSR
jgi:glycosyltransferase involved in cell wall biosynthesis